MSDVPIDERLQDAAHRWTCRDCGTEVVGRPPVRAVDPSNEFRYECPDCAEDTEGPYCGCGRELFYIDDNFAGGYYLCPTCERRVDQATRDQREQNTDNSYYGELTLTSPSSEIED